MAITRWQARPALTMRGALNQLFDESVWQPLRNGNGYGSFYAPMDVYTEGDSYVVEVALPGIAPEQIDVEMVGDTLTIRGEATTEVPEGRQYLVRQRQGGHFQTSLKLPHAADAAQAKASFEHGVLRLEVPKSEAVKPRKIELTAGK